MGRLPPLLQSHFERPRNVGRPLGACARGRGENRACGDLLELFLRLEAGRATEVRFQARACSAVIAVASLATEAFGGRSVAELERFDLARLVESCGGLPRPRAHAVQVVARALREALADDRAQCHPGPGHSDTSAPCSDS